MGIFEGSYGKATELNSTHGTPYDLLERVVSQSQPVRKIEHFVNKNLLAQCMCDGDVYRGDKFLQHCGTNHSGIILRGSIYNVPALIFNII